MPTSEEVIFIELFKAVCRKCFGTDLSSPLTEPESRNLSNEIEEATGLVIGWKSLKNYSLHCFEGHHKTQVNPSVSTLDTLARYLQDAPRTDELKRKQYEAHYPYWFGYRDLQLASNKSPKQKSGPSRYLKPAIGAVAGLLVIVIILITWRWNTGTSAFEDDFNKITQYPGKNGWMVKDPWDSTWDLRSVRPSHITLFTMPGDNIPPDPARQPGIRNLLFRKLDTDCFIAEIHLTDFMPVQNWQQAGILLMEDSTYQARSVRIGMAYNDFFGGYESNAEISVQVLASAPGNNIKPEVVVQTPVFTFKENDTLLIKTNLQKSALRVEKRNNVYRFLFASGSDQLFAFKEIASKTLNIEPRYIAIYASSGNTAKATIIPVWVDKFLVKPDCSD
jgi:hypothetical protein